MIETGYLQLHLAKGVGPVTIRQILSRLTQSGTSLETFLHLPVGEQVKRFGLAHQQAESIQATRVMVEKAWDELQQRGVMLLSLEDAEYPFNLHRKLGEQSPPLIYAWGNLDLLRKKSVGFCGSRDVSPQGLAVAEDCATQVTTWDCVVVSGGARGVDMKVHQSAMASGGSTIIVLPEGILHYRLRSDLKSLVTLENSLLLSEFSPYMGWSVANAMQRNRTVCGLSDALIVIEAGASGGTFEAGKLALRLKTPLFVADYAEPSVSAAGNIYFLTHGANALRRSASTDHANLEPLRRAIEAPIRVTPLAVQERLF